MMRAMAQGGRARDAPLLPRPLCWTGQAVCVCVREGERERERKEGERREERERERDKF